METHPSDNRHKGSEAIISAFYSVFRCKIKSRLRRILAKPDFVQLDILVRKGVMEKNLNNLERVFFTLFKVEC
jgi:hypothetical protein